jgi:uncharacterized protein (TIGR02301 family)
MGLLNRRFLRLALGTLAVAWGCMAFAPIAEAQFFWWFDQPKKAAPKRKAKPPGDDLPPIVPRESSAPPPPDDRPYDAKLMRLAEILGAVHYLRELCGAEEGQIWRDQMKEILRNEGTTAVRRAKLVNSFNDGYRGYRRTYRSCTQSATLATTRFSTEGASIAASLAQGGGFQSNAPAEPKPEASPEAAGAPLPPEPNAGQASEPATGAPPADQTGGLPPADQAAAAPSAGQPAEPPAEQVDTPIEEPPD